MIQKKTLFTQSRVLGSLAVTRALGDYKHKEYIISEPDVTHFKIKGNFRYLLLGTDGFWDVSKLSINLFFYRTIFILS